MSFTISEIEHKEIPSEGMSCSVKGKFYYRISETNVDGSARCYLSESDNSELKLVISDQICEQVIDDDETFGMMVGGEYAYFGLHAEVGGLVKRSANGIVLEQVSVMILSKDGEYQEFSFEKAG